MRALGSEYLRSCYYWIFNSVLFYVVNPFIRKQLAHGEISKIFFLDHFSSSILGQKYYFLSHIQLWPGRPKLSLSYIGCKFDRHQILKFWKYTKGLIFPSLDCASNSTDTQGTWDCQRLHFRDLFTKFLTFDTIGY